MKTLLHELPNLPFGIHNLWVGKRMQAPVPAPDLKETVHVSSSFLPGLF